MKKKVIACIAILIAIVAISLCVLHLPTTYSITIDATQLDAAGNVIGQVEIPVEYVLTGSVFNKTLPKVSVSSFGEFPGFDNAALDKMYNKDAYYVTIGIADTNIDLDDPFSMEDMTNRTWTCTAYVSEDFDLWRVKLTCDGIVTNYVASVSGNRTPQEILDYLS